MSEKSNSEKNIYAISYKSSALVGLNIFLHDLLFISYGWTDSIIN